MDRDKGQGEVNSSVAIRYAVSRDGDDCFPIVFRSDCERTFYSPLTGKDESLVEVMRRADEAGYDIRKQPPERKPRE